MEHQQNPSKQIILTKMENPNSVIHEIKTQMAKNWRTWKISTQSSFLHTGKKPNQIIDFHRSKRSLWGSPEKDLNKYLKRAIKEKALMQKFKNHFYGED